MGQLVQLAYQSALEHITSGTLEKFKDTLKKTLKGGEFFSASSNNYIGCSVALFVEACATVQLMKIFFIIISEHQLF